jgi:Pyruvate/2-oxoacid:ferredoxin oxidoreductase delta subunit
MINYKNLEIYFFSGTGNCMSAANWIGDKAVECQCEVNILPIDRNLKPLPPSESKTLSGFCFPAHGFSIPWYMLKFIARFPRVQKGRRDVFLLNTRAGMKLYKLFTPGLSGVAFIIPIFILLVKGYRIKGVLPLDMPSNWISIHPGIREKVVNSISDRCIRIVNKFSDKILHGKTTIHPIFWILLPLDLLVSPISIGYMLIGRFFIAKTFFASASCNDCRICEEKCPVGAIKIVNDRPYWQFRCESCMRCMNICPKKSINTAHLLAVGIIWIAMLIPFVSDICRFLESHFPSIYALLPGLIELTVATIICLPLFWGIYGLYHQLVRVKSINNLFTYTSFTYYWRRYIARGVKPSSFKVSNKEKLKTDDKIIA